MQTDSKKETIDGVEFEVFMLPPKVGRDILVDMSRVIAPALGALADAKGGLLALMNSEVGDISASRFQSLASALADKLDKKMLDEHMRHLVEVTAVNGVPLSKTFDLQFRGRIGLMLKWYAFALRTNFADFIETLGNASKSLRDPKVEKE